MSLEKTSTKTIDVTNNNAAKKKKKTGPWRDVFNRLKKNKMAMFGLVIIILLVFLALSADFIAPYGYDDQNLKDRLISPNSQYLLGTDNFGRDILSRIIYGSRISLQVGFIAVGISAIIGGALGSIAGYYGGRLDNFIMRAMDILLAIPSILLAISIVAALGPGLQNVMIAVGIGSIPSYARIVRASVLSIRDQEFVEAARAVGANDFRIITKHILPNAMAPIIVQATLGVAGAILSAAGLSFIGLGIQPPTPEWGAMLSSGREYLRDNWYVATFPGLAIMITIFALNLLGDGLRDALDPRLKN
ncbi:ABC transporter permease [Alkaliphilus oremlandii]|uniref:Binding-protein-dependent transport systems inner membrane component n=1 Tax=Alkaliphilus oremlandii (strain OhILAs) TaxID=350688 RepID=A8MH07_ALKOO|nr:ABC transporter permease [Alkaliphilus oremlandii]ABW18894.1 binding-protein-dependent transport systems inner membrane component [Alkaliphilus oremlandii OhILAs]